METPIASEIARQQLPVEDHLEILNLYARYTHTIDANQIDAWVDCYVPDGILYVPAFKVDCRGAEELAALGAAWNERGGGREKHITTNISVYGSGDRARGTAYLALAVGGAGRVKPDYYATGRYEDELRRTADGWRFVRRDLAMDRP